ncbi:metallophosphoesterase family protein [Flavisolibacter ginsenosidimutans]|uniref:Metallophosphoesterase n=1 Tax=Flavisolibacter ginsenosidimutans TaxID=661481 RepID=A0A5B8UFU8_9BACT|nr:metallophosphoesterase [Flavisolibacter ginsenosidimutans]QEC55292.1 metallophosphoesterase [Flavisolibacter ginsenosidimutans]
MKQKIWLITTVLLVLISSCRKNESLFVFKGNSPHLKIAVVSDIHYMSSTLITNNGTAGEAFQNYLNQDPKLLEFSDPIFRTVLSQLKAEQPDIVLIPGDLTKDGERISHEAMASFLSTLTNTGSKVYVIPGNHDINNAKAARFDGNASYPVANIQPTDFSSIYGKFGYNDALERDAHSLSYLVQPQQGLWILAIDASRYEEYGPEGDIADGRIKPETLAWILSKLAQAKEQNITVFAMMHHNLVEHYAGQTQLDPGYVVDNWQTVAAQLADAGLKVIFTGHYHANDITPFVHEGHELYDIETGSLVTPTSPYRIITVKNKDLDIRTAHVQSIGVPLPHGLSFPAYSDLFINTHLDGYFYNLLTGPYNVPGDLATFAAPIFRNAIKAHFAGDEKMPPDQRKLIDELRSMAPQLADMATTLWTDLGVKDNDLPLKLQ